MNQRLSFLILTDHRLHTLDNPVYSLIPALRKHPDCAHVDIASRGNPANDAFFYKYQHTKLEVFPVLENFGFEEEGSQFQGTGELRSLHQYDGILMRLQRPVEPAFMVFLTEIAKDVVFINHPLGIETTSNKAFLLNFMDLCPPMKLCLSVEEILDFANQFPIVLKPLKEYGGKGLVKIDGDKLFEGNIEHSTQDFLQRQAAYIKENGYLAMKFLENVLLGDKRILLIGETIMGASLRLPAKGSWLCNVAQGGGAVPANIAPEEEYIIQQILPFLKKEGILIAGIDTLMGDEGHRVLSEINTMSVGGFKDIQAYSDKPVIQYTIQMIIDYVQQN